MVEAIVEFDYTALEADELSLRKGDKITDVKIQPGGWWEGTLAGKRGMFPDNFVKVVSKSDSSMKSSSHNDVTLRSKTGRRCKVLFSYQPANEDELRLNVDDIIDVIAEVEDGWWKGSLGENVGVFPSNFVTEILAEEPRRPRPGSRDETRTRVLDSESEGDRSTSASSPDSSQPVDSTAGGGDVEPDVPSLPPKPVKEQCRVVFGYEAANGDELNLKEGDIVTVLSRDVQDKGWWRGELSGRVGLFPDNFVELIQPPAEAPLKPERVVVAKPASAATNKLRDSITRTAVKSEHPPAKAELPPVPCKKPLVSLPGRKDHVDGAGPSRQLRSVDSNLKPFTARTDTATSRSLDSATKATDSKSSDTTGPKSLEPAPEVSVFDNVGRGAMLTHPTASRVKPPTRRPPSNTNIVKEEEPTLTNGTSTENIHHDEPTKKSWEKNQAPWMEELKLNQTKKKGVDLKGVRPQSMHGMMGTSPPTTRGNARPVTMVKTTTAEVAGNGVTSVMSKSIGFKSEPLTKTAVTTKEPREKTDVGELLAMVRSLQASLDQHKEATARDLQDLAQKLTEERQKRVQVELQLNKLTDLVTQV